MEIAAKQRDYRMKQSWREASMQVSNSSVARPLKLEHFGAGFEAGLEGLKAMEIGEKQYDKEGAFFGPQNVTKSRRAKMGFPSSRFQPQLLLVKSAST